MIYKLPKVKTIFERNAKGKAAVHIGLGQLDNAMHPKVILTQLSGLWVVVGPQLRYHGVIGILKRYRHTGRSMAL